MSEPDEPSPDLDAWAHAHGFEPSDRRLAGETPLLRLGLVDVTMRAYEGAVRGHGALLSEFSIGSPSVLEAFGTSDVVDTWFTLFMVKIDAPEWPRITVHPSGFAEGDWLTRLLHRDDHRVRGISPEFDDRYRARVANGVPDEQVEELFDLDFVDWCLSQPELIFDVEANVETGDSLVVARRGLGLEDPDLDVLLARTEYLVDRFSRGPWPGPAAA
jgi:hypothetical protein